jgi:hypothetical protein
MCKCRLIFRYKLTFNLYLKKIFVLKFYRDADPHSFSKLDPDPRSPKRLDLDPYPHKINADTKYCYLQRYS